MNANAVLAAKPCHLDICLLGEHIGIHQIDPDHTIQQDDFVSLLVDAGFDADGSRERWGPNILAVYTEENTSFIGVKFIFAETGEYASGFQYIPRKNGFVDSADASDKASRLAGTRELLMENQRVYEVTRQAARTKETSLVSLFVLRPAKLDPRVAVPVYVTERVAEMLMLPLSKIDGFNVIRVGGVGCGSTVPLLLAQLSHRLYRDATALKRVTI